MTSFVDAGGWLSVASRRDQHHAAGKSHFAALLAERARLLTTDFVLDEVFTRIRYDVGHAKAIEFLDRVRQAEGTGVLTIRRIEADLWGKAEAIFRQFDSAPLSFTDCTSFALLRETRVDEVFGFDSHFAMMGFLLRPN